MSYSSYETSLPRHVASLAHYADIPCFWRCAQTLRRTLAVWPAADYKEGSFLTRRDRLSLACSGRQLPARRPSISSSSPFSGLSSVSCSSSCPQAAIALPVPFHPHATRRVRPGRDNPRQPEAGAINGIVRGGMDNHILSTASVRGKEAAATVITIDRPWPNPLLPQGLLETPLFPRPAANGTPIKGESSAFEGQLAAFTTGLGGSLGLRGRLQGRRWSWGQLHGASGAGGGSGGALPSRGGARRLRSGGCPPPSPLPFCQLPGNSSGLPCPGSTPAHREPAAAGGWKLPLPPPAGRRHPRTHQRGSLTSPVAPALTRHRHRSPARRHAAPGDRARTGCRRRAGGARPAPRTPGCSTALRPPGGSSSERPAGGARPGAAPALQCRALRAQRPPAPRTGGGSGVSLPGAAASAAASPCRHRSIAWPLPADVSVEHGAATAPARLPSCSTQFWSPGGSSEPWKGRRRACAAPGLQYQNLVAWWQQRARHGAPLRMRGCGAAVPNFGRLVAAASTARRANAHARLRSCSTEIRPLGGSSEHGTARRRACAAPQLQYRTLPPGGSTRSPFPSRAPAGRELSDAPAQVAPSRDRNYLLGCQGSRFSALFPLAAQTVIFIASCTKKHPRGSSTSALCG